MSLRAQLHAYIGQLEQRLRWGTWLRGLAILTCSGGDSGMAADLDRDWAANSGETASGSIP